MSRAQLEPPAKVAHGFNLDVAVLQPACEGYLSTEGRVKLDPPQTVIRRVRWQTHKVRSREDGKKGRYKPPSKKVLREMMCANVIELNSGERRVAYPISANFARCKA